MTIPDDKRKHLIGALVILAWVLAILWAYGRFGLVSALSVASLAGPGLELYQKVRHEGTPDPRDAAWTMAPFLIAALICHLNGWRYI